MLPELNIKSSNVTLLNTFLGVNKNLQIQDAEFSDMKNITNDYFPVIANRKKRGVMDKMTKPQGMLGGSCLSYVDDNKLYYDEEYVCDLEKTDAERQLVIMGAYLCVFPDGVVYNTYKKEIDHIENEVTKSMVSVSLAKMDGTLYDDSNTVWSDREPEDKTLYWVDMSQTPVIMKMYSESLASWVSVATTYIKVAGEGIGNGFQAYDAARFSGFDTGHTYNNMDLNQTNIIYAAGEDYLIIAGLIDEGWTNSRDVTIKRELPELDFVCENNNRLWGCSSINHEVYSCKQGDPKNWNFFGGLDSDSYAATVGTQNIFTGCISYAGYVFFFKEDGYHRVYGSKPSEFQIQWKPGRGVQLGSEKSIAIVNEMLFFKARDAVCAYDGSIVSISDNLGTEPYYDAIGVGYREKYYISMRDSEYRWRLYVYDISKGTWCIEDDINVKYMAYANNGTYIVDSDNNVFVINNEKIYRKYFPLDPNVDEKYHYPGKDIYPGNIPYGEMEDDFDWNLETGDIGMDSPLHKYVKSLNIRFMLAEQSKMKIEIMYDSTDDWENVMEFYCTKKRSYEIPVSIKRCDHFRIRFSGRGDFRIFSIAKSMEGGSGR